jgi:putative oxidoreductase
MSHSSIASRFEAVGYAALRIVSGFLFSFHGMQKLFGWLTERAGPEVGTQLWFGGLIELVCGGLVALGLFTRWAALLASGTMAVAYFQFHWKFEFASWRWLPAVNGGELAVIYCFVFLYIALKGTGRAGLDRILWRAKSG